MSWDPPASGPPGSIIVTAYGAKGDGVTDNYASITAADAAASAAHASTGAHSGATL